MPIVLNEKLIEEVSPFLIKYGFDLLFAPRQFRKIHSGGFCNVIVTVGNSLPALAELHVGIRLDLVEQLAYQFTTGLIEYGPHSTTLITSAGRIIGQPYHRFSLEHPSDINTVAEQVRQFMQTDGFAFLEKYQRVEALDELFNASPHESSPYLTNRLHRSLRGIILARLAYRSHWERLVTNYRAQLTLRGTPEAMMQNYDRLADYLRTFSVN